MPRMGDERLRLNVSARLGHELVGKFLVVVDSDAGMHHLHQKLAATLRRGGVNGTVERILNENEAALPHDEMLGDMLRDGEGVIVLLRGSNTSAPGTSNCGSTPMHDVGSPDHGNGAMGALQGNVSGLPISALVTLPASLATEAESSESEEDVQVVQPRQAEYPPPPVLPREQPHCHNAPVPGPMEEFEAESMPREVIHIDHPSRANQLSTYDNDWLLESLSPRLREFLLAHFQEDLITEPKFVPSIGKFVGARFYQACGSFVSVFMRPQTSLGSDPAATMPVHYYIAKADLLTFQRFVEAQLEETRHHLDQLTAVLHGLQGLLARGMADSEHVEVLLPHTYDALSEIDGIIVEAEQPVLPRIDGEFPILICDTSAGVRKQLPWLRAALKRVIHLHMDDKRAFQMIRFAATGEPRLWAEEMVPPSAQVLVSAEDWIDGLAPVAHAQLLSAVRIALGHPAVDAVYLISSADTDPADHERILTRIHDENKHGVTIHTVAIDAHPHGELLLRNIAESNHGDVHIKSSSRHAARSFGMSELKWTSWRTHLVNEKSRQLSDTFKKQKLSIGGQIRIIDVMLREEGQLLAAWQSEWNCAQRLASSSRNDAPDQDMLKDLERKSSRTQTTRVGGGFAYSANGTDLSLEPLFERRSAQPWTTQSDTVASGPRMPGSEAGQSRAPRLPPSTDFGTGAGLGTRPPGKCLERTRQSGSASRTVADRTPSARRRASKRGRTPKPPPRTPVLPAPPVGGAANSCDARLERAWSF